ncbi:hypothetical protein ElyMa_005378600 [Elysia marginata]|uniref:Uncharacterized protein n=1 Tax=Elysia marginata TaxID=1093978 RepID=A0AAV4EDP4_9GAST|nr:hypothetical protein ElyMa_005378600 [Elysia marginata]
MWLQVLLVAAFAFSAAEGMCFGVQFMQQQITCPGAMVYYPQLCICIEPQLKTRLHDEISFTHDAPNILTRSTSDPFDPLQTNKGRLQLQALRHHLTARLPDTGFHNFVRSVARRPTAADNPLYLFADRSYQNYQRPLQPVTEMTTMYFPKSWGMGGLNDYWRQRKPETVLNKQGDKKWLPQTNQVHPLPLIETLKPRRKAWQDAALRQAHNRFGNQALAQKFLSLATQAISPDTSRHRFQRINNAVAPDSPSNKFYISPQKTVESLLALKEAALMKLGLENILPQRTVRRANSFIQSATARLP